ncbi:hypothetical protein [Micromonospora aurantiaca (nom. illeg.)]|uniref:hypothetical protein n=1 Tax=Micromonospora aurantiaca (nom. illeg.) TaxID=47850 RepID=UPI0011A79BDE|nr:hypothetical protein [Micromonospora aurantiaca]MBC9005171.1 hypothetical protein [Micromonospora aurantiaca]
MDAYELQLLHEAEETAARELAVWDALAVHVGGPLVAWHRGAAVYRLDAVNAAQVRHLALGVLAAAVALYDEPAAAVLGDVISPRRRADLAAVGVAFVPVPAGRIDLRAGERPARVKETPW